jgi:hypothetical protein
MGGDVTIEVETRELEADWATVSGSASLFFSITSDAAAATPLGQRTFPD